MNRLKFTLLFALCSTLCIGQNLVNIDSRGVMLDGYDVVELCKKNEVPGSYKHTAVYNGATYQFSSERRPYILLRIVASIRLKQR